MKKFFREKKQKLSGWASRPSDPIKDCIKGAMSMGYSEREAEIFIECLMGEREYSSDLHFDLIGNKLRRSLER